MKPAISERVSRAVTMEVGAGDPIGGCDSKTARNSALFPGPVLAGGCESCGELALVERVGDLKTVLLRVGGLA